MKATKTPITLAVEVKREDGYFHINAYPAFEEEGKLRHFDNRYDGGKALYLEDFRVSCQGDHRPVERERPKLYAFECRFHPFCVDARMCPRMAKTFQRIEKGTAKLDEARGYCRSFGEYLTRVAEVLGAETITVAGRKQTTPFNRDQDRRSMNLGMGRNHIDHIEREWSDSLMPQPATEAATV